MNLTHLFTITLSASTFTHQKNSGIGPRDITRLASCSANVIPITSHTASYSSRFPDTADPPFSVDAQLRKQTIRPA